MTQDQNRLLQSRLAQLQGFTHAGNAEKSHLAFQQPGDLHRAMTVGVRLDDGHNRNPGLALHRVKVGEDGVHVDVHIGIVV